MTIHAMSKLSRPQWIMLAKLITLVLVLLVGAEWVKTHYRIGINVYYDTLKSCDDHRLFLVRLTDGERPAVGDYVQFLAPVIPGIFAERAFMTKEVVALPGDRVRVTRDAVFVNGERLGGRPLVAKAEALGLTQYTSEMDFTVKEGEFFGLGKREEFSFDSRYWGTAKLSDIRGEVSWAI